MPNNPDKQDYVFGLSEKAADAIASTNQVIADYGQFLALIFPNFFGFVVALNIMKLMALSPVKFPRKINQAFRLFVKLDHTDPLTIPVKNSFYSEQYKHQKAFHTENEEFQFVSIYPRFRGLKVILRIIVNSLFILFASRVGSILFHIKSEVRNSKVKKTENPNQGVQKKDKLESIKINTLPPINQKRNPSNSGSNSRRNKNENTKQVKK